MRIYLGLGTNIGRREEILYTAIELINQRIGKVISLSAFHDTEPEGFTSEHRFLNAACGVETTCPPLELLDKTEAIERDLGRTSKSTNGIYQDRILDIDILLAGELVLKTDRLTIPHPLMHERVFVMEPLAEIAPEVVHPLLGKNLEEVLKGLLK